MKTYSGGARGEHAVLTRATMALAASGLACASLAGCAKEATAADAFYTADQYKPGTETCMTILDHAALRTTPEVDYTNAQTKVANLIVELEVSRNQELAVEGLATTIDFKNGPWYGVTVHDLMTDPGIAAQIPSYMTNPKFDQSSLVWVNSQRAWPSCS